jgi:hypothetical protein
VGCCGKEAAYEAASALGARASAAKYTSSGRSKKLRGRRGAGRRIVEEKLFMKRGKKWLNVTARLKRSVK